MHFKPLRHRFAAAALLVSAGTAGAMLPAGTATATPASGASTTTLQLAWGTTPSAPAGFRGDLSAVSAGSPTNVWAVGAYNPNHPTSVVLDQPYAEHWDGARWTATTVSPPALFGDSQSTQLSGVATIGAGDAWAVGSASDSSSLAARTLAYHWNGTAWTRVTTPNPGGANGNTLRAVVARTGSDVWAVGGTGYPERSLVLHWNGTAWSTVTVPDIGRLDAVTTDATGVWVSGGRSVLRFDGTRWVTLPPLPTTGNGSLTVHGLAKSSAGLYAVGALAAPAGEGTDTVSYAAVFDGTAWTTAGSTGTGLEGVAANGDTVLATGLNAGVLRLSPTGTTSEVIPLQGTVSPDAISIDPSGHAWAVGDTSANGTILPAIITSPGLGQGGLVVDAGAGGATVTVTGPVTQSGTAGTDGRLSIGGLPVGTYTVLVSLGGCPTKVVSATVTTGVAAPVDARITC